MAVTCAFTVLSEIVQLIGNDLVGLAGGNHLQHAALLGRKGSAIGGVAVAGDAVDRGLSPGRLISPARTATRALRMPSRERDFGMNPAAPQPIA